MKRILFLLTLLLAICIHVQAWDTSVNREVKGKQTNWRWRIYTPNYGTESASGPSKILYVYAADGSRNIYGNVNLPYDMWDVVFNNIETGQKTYIWRYYPYTELGDGLFKDTQITGVTGLYYAVSSSWVPFNIQRIGSECFRNSRIQGEVYNYTPESVTSLGGYAFAGCTNLSGSLITPKNVTIINDGTYEGCTGMTGYCYVQPKVTVIGKNAFKNCSNMHGSLTLNNGLQQIQSNAFYNCSRLEGDLNIPNSVYAMGDGAFANCNRLNGKLSYSTGMTSVPPYTFQNCSNLQGNIFIPSKVTDIGTCAFQNCENFDGKLYLSGNVWYIGSSAFENCKKLNGNLDLHTVTHLGEKAFSFCYGFNGTLTLSNGLVNVPEDAFHSCTKLTGSLNIPSAAYIGARAFYNCQSLNGTITLPNSLQYIGDDAFIDCQGLYGDLRISRSTSIGNRAFKNLRGLNGILTLPSDLQTIGEEAFVNCENLKGDLRIPSCVSIGNKAFFHCRSFNGRLYLPSNLQVIGSDAFWGCQKLKGDLVLPSSLKKIGGDAFAECYHLTGNVIIPASVNSIGIHAFWQCQDLESITFATGSQLTASGLGAEVFPHCLSLKYIDMTNCHPITTSLITRIGGKISPFGELRPYTIVYLPNGSNAAKVIGDNFVLDGKCKSFIVYDTHADYKGNRGCDYEIKHQFTAAKANYTRTFSGKDAATLFLPYPTTLPAGMTAYELKNLKRAGGKSIFVFAPLPSSATLEANKAYVVRVTDGGSHNLPEMHNVIVPVTPALASTATLGTADNNWQFNGTTQFIPNATAASMKAYNLNVGNTWLPVTTANTNGHIHSFRAFLTSPTGTAPAKSFVMLLDDGPVITNIDSIRKGEADVQSGRYPFYSLDGRNLGRDYNRLPSDNIYIVNGKKFYKN